MTFFYDPKTPVDPNTPEKTTRDGVVDGDNNANVINAAYTGDPEGDKIDNNDAIIGTDTGDQDIVDARGGDDKVYAGADDDEVYAGAGNDTVYGGTGDDLIYGDSGYTGGTIGKTTGDENMFRWSELPDPDGSWHGKVDDGDDLENMTLTQQVGGVKVTVTTPPRPSWHSNGLETEFDNEAIYVGGLKDSINTRSSLESEADNGESGTYKIGFDKAVDQVRFNITDIDADVGYVRVLAYGPDGTLIPVDFQAGSGLSVGANNTITANDDHQDARTDADAAVTVTITGPVSRIEVIHAGDGHGQSNIYISDIGIVETFETIEGTDGEATAAQGAGADFLNGDAGNDTIYGQGGDDTINGGDDDDLLVGGSGNDSIDGGSGNDVIYGDNAGETPPSSTETVRESFEWDQAGVANGHDLDGFTQNTGNVNVTFKILQETGAADTEFSTDQQKVHSIKDDGKGVDAYSSLDSETKGQGNQADYELSFSDAVENVSFRVNDIDGDGVVRIRAYDANGKEINVDMTGGAKLTLIDSDGKFGVDTADSNGGYEEDTSGNYSILVDIPGPVSRITIEHDQNGSNNSGINVTDIYFDAKVGVPAGEDGNDVLNGGDGDDMIFGEGGNDTLTGGQGDDTLSGGDDADVIFGGAGDVVDGGAGGFDVDPAKNTDNDTLDLTGQGPFYITDKVVDSNGNGFNGTIVFVDGDGKPTGDTLTFTEVENIIGDEVNRGPDAMDDTATTDEDTAVTIDVLANDTDPDGDSLTIKSATVSADQGTVEIVDNKLVFTPAENFNGDATITYVVQDGNGGEDTGEAVVTVNPVNDDPVAVDDTATTDENTAVTIDVLANDTDVDGDTLTIKSATVPADQGTVDIVDNKVVFTPATDFVGDATITYVVQDGNGGEDTGEAVVTVNNVNDAPDAVDDVAATFNQDPVLIDALANDTDPDGDKLTITNVSVPAALGVAIIQDNKVLFTPAADYEGIVNISYTVEDPSGASDTANIQVTVNDGIVSGTAGNDLINAGYTGDVGGDMVDAGDNEFSDDPTKADDDIIEAGDGNDTVFAGNGNDLVNGGEGNDSLNGGMGNDTLNGEGGNDTINGGAGDDLINGGAGDDVIKGGDGSDTIYGGDGNDVITSSDPDNDFKIDKGYPGLFTGEEGTPAAENERDFVDGGAGNDTISTGDDRDTVYGGTGNDVIDAGIDDDEVYGDDGDDRIVGGEGSDIIYGGIGNDTIYAGNDPLKVPDSTNIEDDGSNPFGADKRQDNGRDTVYGGAGNDVIYGADDDDLLYGDEGDDYIDGEIDDDTIFGGVGNDTLMGGQGNDEIDGGEGNDYINAGRNADTVYGGAGNDTIFGENGADKLYGGDGDDWIDGGTGDDTLDGGDGDDMIIGATGDDVMTGGAGNDTIDGGNGGDDMMSGGDGRDTFLNANAGDTVDGGTGGDDFDTLDLTGAGKYEYVSRTVDADGDSTSGTIRFLNADGTSKGTLDFYEIESIIPCFTPGTLIATPKGERRVEDLQVGDRVITRDNGIQEIRWVGQKAMTGAEFERAEHLKPVLIQKGALGGGLPERDMMVSPNHRVLVANDKTALYFEEREVLVAAKHLTGLKGVDIVDVSATTYIHLMFDQHEVILSDGAWTESFQPGDLTLAGIGNAQRNELFELFPELKTREGIDAYTSARRSLKKHEAVLLTK
ncbi:Hint domain-containing protein [Sulfitobacter pseudonitzschiae]|nr:Hint domain-containing protein [Pseudosulfitobacter pseudonitzschiae]